VSHNISQHRKTKDKNIVRTIFLKVFNFANHIAYYFQLLNAGLYFKERSV
jgi:hypothetical protein